MSELPPVFRSVYSARIFFQRLSLYAGTTIAEDVEKWSPLRDWWTAAEAPPRSHVLEQTPEIESVVASLREWKPDAPAPGPLDRIYAKLARLYRERAPFTRIAHALPGPLDARHPGFVFSFDPKKRRFEACERTGDRLAEPLRLTLVLPLDPKAPLRFEGQAFAEYGVGDAWELFALRAMLLAIAAGEDAAVRALSTEIGRPVWDHVLEGMSERSGLPTEWAFTITAVRDEFKLTAQARSGAKTTKSTFAAILAESGAEIDLAVARLALGAEAMKLGTPQAHALLQALARHPRVMFEDKPAAILAGRLSIRFIEQRGVLGPVFRADGEPLPIPIESLTGNALFRGGAHASTIVSLEIPAALRPWVEARTTLGDALVFPPEATTKLLDRTRALVEAGLVELPRAALGELVAYKPSVALRIEWRGEEAIVEPMITVHPGAPFVPAGVGPKLFTFTLGERRVYVERDASREQTIAGDAVDTIDAMGVRVAWQRGVGHTLGIEATIALAAWLEKNPLGFPIEVKVGRAPVVRSLTDADGKIKVKKRGSWLRLEGEIAIDGAKLTLGDVLEAARHAQRYVRAERGVFVELSEDAIAKLRPVAIAAELAPGHEPALHDAFGSILASATSIFDVEGIDLDAYMRRFETKHVRVSFAKLRDYQKAGVEWMLRLASWTPGCILADDMGLGKTVQAAIVLEARSKQGPALVVAPASVAPNWLLEVPRFTGLRIRAFDPKASLDDLGSGDVLVVSYGLLQRRAGELAARRWATVVIDEAQFVKNPSSQRRDAVRLLPRDFTIALTGTPLENHLGELFSIVDLAFPGLLGDEALFRERFRRPIEVHRDMDRLAVLSLLLEPFLLRRTRASVLSELPPREEITLQIEPSAPERRRYLALREACEKAVSKQKSTPGQLRIALLAALTRLRQIACDPGLVDPTYDGPSTKLDRVVSLGREIAEEGNHAVVFSQFSRFIERVADALEAKGLRVARLTGKTPSAKRQRIIDAFQAGDYDVFCISLLAGGTGLNLTKANYVIHLDPWWNPAAEEQASSRAHRMGQLAPVTIYRLVTRGTIEEAVLDMHAAKRELAASVLEGKGDPKVISSAELLTLLRF